MKTKIVEIITEQRVPNLTLQAIGDLLDKVTEGECLYAYFCNNGVSQGDTDCDLIDKINIATTYDITGDMIVVYESEKPTTMEILTDTIIENWSKMP